MCIHTHTHTSSVRASSADTVSSSMPGAIVTTAPSTILGTPLDKRTTSESEFVSDTLRSTETDLEEVKAGMKLLGIDTLASQSEKSGKMVEGWTERG